MEDTRSQTIFLTWVMKMTKDNKTKMLECPICGKEFKGENGLNSHVGQVHNETRKATNVTEEEKNIIIDIYSEGKTIKEVSEQTWVTRRKVSEVIDKSNKVSKERHKGDSYGIKRKCDFCGEKFEGRMNAKYCSKTCKNLAQIDPDYFHVFYRDHFRCRYCGRTPADNVKLTIDHVYPQSKGGNDDKINLVTACQHCNSRKSDRLWPKERIKEIMLQNRRLQKNTENLEFSELVKEVKEKLKYDN